MTDSTLMRTTCLSCSTPIYRRENEKKLCDRCRMEKLNKKSFFAKKSLEGTNRVTYFKHDIFQRFKDPILEREYIEYYYGKRILRLRLGTLLGHITWLGFLVTDFTNQELKDDPTLYYLNIAIRVAAELVALLSSIPLLICNIWKKKHAIYIIEIASLIQSLSFSCAVSFKYGLIPNSPPSGALLVVLVLLLLIRIRIFFILITCILTIIFYIIPIVAWYHGLFMISSVPYVHILIYAVIVGLLALMALINEKNMRRLFILKKQLQYNTEDVEYVNQRSIKILENILPPHYIPLAKTYPNGFIQEYDNLTMLVTDLVGFTKFSSTVSAKDLLHILNRHFSVFDGLTLDLGLEKIKTVGDAYLCLDFNNKDGTRNAAILGLKLIQKLKEMNRIFNEDFKIRIGMAYDRCIVGVLGSGKITFDVFGPAKLTAELMEQTCKENMVHITKEVYDKILPWFECIEELDDSGEYQQPTYFIVESKTNLDDMFETVAYGSTEAKEALEDEEDNPSEMVPIPPFEPLPMTLQLPHNYQEVKGTKKLEKELVQNLKHLEKMNFDQYQLSKAEKTLSHQRSQASVDYLIENNSDFEFDNVADDLVDVNYEYAGTMTQSGSSSAKLNFQPPKISYITVMPKKFSETLRFIKSNYAHQVNPLRAMGIAFACCFTGLTIYSIMSYLDNIPHLYHYSLIVKYVINLLVWFHAIMFLFPCLSRSLIVGVYTSLVYAFSVVIYVYLDLGNINPDIMTNMTRMNIVSILFAITMLTVIPYPIKVGITFLFIPFIILVNIYGTFIINTLFEYFAVQIFCYFISYVFHQSLISFYVAEVTMKNGVKLLKQESERSEALLRSSLPDNIIKRVYEMASENNKTDATTTTSSTGTVDIYDDIKNGYVMFVKVDGFDKIQHAKLAVEMLNDIFAWFDVFCDHMGVQKIKSIGGTYLCSSESPKKLAECAILFIQVAQSHFKIYEEKIRQFMRSNFTPSTPSHSYLRIFGPRLNVDNIEELIGLKIGLNQGSIAAGVLGKSKFLYDIFGDTVNMASRMCTLSHRNQIQISSKMHDELKKDFICVKRGTIKVKGKGSLDTYYLLHQKITSVLASPLSPFSPKGPPRYSVSKKNEQKLRSKYEVNQELSYEVSDSPFSPAIVDDHLTKVQCGYYEETPVNSPAIDGTTPSMLFTPDQSFPQNFEYNDE